MALDARQAARCGPAPIAVHDDRHMQAAILQIAFIHKVSRQKKSRPALALARRPNQRFHVVQIPFESLPALRAQAVFGLGQPPSKNLEQAI